MHADGAAAAAAQALAPHRFQAQPSLPRCLHDDELPVTVPEEDLVAIDEDETHLPDLTDLEAEIAHTNAMSRSEELRCVLAVVRHGDRTPKQKLKLKARRRRPGGVGVRGSAGPAR